MLIWKESIHSSICWVSVALTRNSQWNLAFDSLIQANRSKRYSNVAGSGKGNTKAEASTIGSPKLFSPIHSVQITVRYLYFCSAQVRLVWVTGCWERPPGSKSPQTHWVSQNATRVEPGSTRFNMYQFSQS